VYETCSKTTFACQVKVLTIGGVTVTVPHQPAPYSQYGASMDETAGAVYYIRSTIYCGLFVELDRWPLSGGAATTIYALSEGIDGNSTSLAPDATTPGNIDLLYSQWDCLVQNADIYQIESVNTLAGLNAAAAPDLGSTGSLSPRALAKQRAGRGGAVPPG
jgi:hypothetical protein